MANLNPYQAPQASVADIAPGGSTALRDEPRSVSAGQGWQWIVDGFAMFRQAPIPWIVIVIVAFVVVLALGLIPIIGQLAGPFISVIFAGGVMQGCRALDRQEDLTIGHLFSGFQTHLTPLIIVAALYMAATLVLVLIAGAVGFGSTMGMMRGGSGAAGGMVTGFLIVMLVMFALFIPLVMAIWFAPALVVLHDVAPTEALKRSFGACLRNIVPFLVYGVIGFVLAIVASIPLMLGWLALGPTFSGSVYAAYRDILVDDAG